MSTSTRKWKALIVDDEDLARKLVREMLSTHPEIDIAAECANGMEAVKAVSEHKPDLLFLDVQMPKLTGFDVLELIDRVGTAVVFVTAFDQYAMKAFDVHAIPHTFTIDAAGVLQDEHIGDASIEGKLRKQLARAREFPAADMAAPQ